MLFATFAIAFVLMYTGLWLVDRHQGAGYPYAGAAWFVVGIVLFYWSLCHGVSRLFG